MTIWGGGRDGDGQKAGSREHWPGCTCSESQGGESHLGEGMGREKEEVNSCTIEEKKGRRSLSKVNEAGKDEIGKKRKQKMYRGKMNFKTSMKIRRKTDFIKKSYRPRG